jgi:hypothetical protein
MLLRLLLVLLVLLPNMGMPVTPRRRAAPLRAANRDLVYPTSLRDSQRVWEKLLSAAHTSTSRRAAIVTAFGSGSTLAERSLRARDCLYFLVERLQL